MKNCLVCNSEFLVANWNKDQKYCSPKCKGIASRKQETRECPQCKINFVVQKADPKKYCSCKCRGEADKKRIIIQCKFCGKDIESLECKNQKYCNEECYGNSRRKNDEHNTCSKCGEVKHKCKMANASWCKQCAGLSRKATLEKPHNRHKYAKNAARVRGLEWTITEADHLEIFKMPCHYCEGLLNTKGCALDRINDIEGYHINNVVPCCGRCNRVRHDYFTYEEMIILGQTIKMIEQTR